MKLVAAQVVRTHCPFAVLRVHVDKGFSILALLTLEAVVCARRWWAQSRESPLVATKCLLHYQMSPDLAVAETQDLPPI